MKHLVVLHFLFIKEENLSNAELLYFYFLLHKRGILWTQMRVLVSKGFYWHKTAVEKCFAELLNPILEILQCSLKQLGKHFEVPDHPSLQQLSCACLLIIHPDQNMYHCIEVNFGLYGFMNTHVKCTGAEEQVMALTKNALLPSCFRPEI